ncbi:DNA polymerase III, subunits gamma and tau [Chthoniobacter flavus Ellin428]|uniref:DNA polymerase III subunit gamma/tau n=1 Tax=Chthoniobacter flavus Ellin428 TaxID=497964 RepID=B4CYL6_9BACT|nr:DNA polymerase III subunit gamma/tau [Chthoniobacter flavus]EDY20557.1 DNA polymerase III, subunits gamma and tau [Chthoniobacter flavus Ellin428]
MRSSAQAHIVTTLKNAIAQNRLAQAYLFVGPRGTGKTSTARIFAKALNCVHAPTTNPCGVCDMCKEIAAGNSLNVLEFDAASNTQVDKIREIIIDNVKYAPTRGNYKLYIVDEVHMLSNSSFNALLKTLEEPPPHVKFVFATTDVQKVPTTIISRCQRFDLRRIPTPEIAQHLLFIAGKEAIELTPTAAESIARGAEGGLRDAESMLDQLVAFCGDKIDEQNVLNIFGFTARQTVAELCEHLINGHTGAALGAIQKQSDAGKDLSRLMADLIEHLRNLLVAQSAPETLHEDLSAEAIAELTAQAGRIAADKLLNLIEQFADAESRMKWAANKKMHFEIAAIRAVQTLGQASLTEVLDTLTAIRGGGAMPERPVKKVEAPKTPVAAVAEKKTERPKPAPVSSPAPVAEPAAPVSVPAPAEAPASRPSLSAFVAASIGGSEKKTPAAAPKPDPKVSAEPAHKVEAKPAATVAPSANAQELWPQLVTRVRKDRPLISDWVESGQLTDVSSGVALLSFPPSADLARDTCERPNNRGFLEKLLTELTGAPVTLKTETRAGLVVEKLAREEAKPEPKVDPMEAFKNDPLIQKALAEFKAEILPA